MNLEELRGVRRTERQKDSLQHLRDSFYEDVAAFIAERKAERRRAADAAEDPFDDPDVGRLTDEIETAEDVVESIYERRVGKVVKLASFAAADMSADRSGLTAEERELFDSLVAKIKQNRQAVLDVLSGEGGEGSATADAMTEPSPTVAGEESTPTDEAPAPADDPAAPDDVLTDAMGGSNGDAVAADAHGNASEGSAPGATADSGTSDSAPDVPPDVPPDAPPDASAPDAPVIDSDEADNEQGESEETERVTVRITEDIGQILGVDEREYDLESEDVVTLPVTNAGPLLDRDAAEKLE